jgi:hypothetical protein
VCKKHNEESKKIIEVWQNNFMCTRLVVMAFFDKTDDLNDLILKLTQNQKDIGDTFSNKFGTNAKTIITNNLTRHVQLILEVLESIDSGSTIDQTRAMKKFYDNGDVIGTQLDEIFMTNKFKNHMKIHIESLINNILSFYHREHKKDITTLDLYFSRGLDMVIDITDGFQNV